jgi:hypothetical protein
VLEELEFERPETIHQVKFSAGFGLAVAAQDRSAEIKRFL